MQELNQLVQRCATATVSIDSSDLAALAQLHSDILAVRLLAADNTEQKNIFDAAEHTAQLVEKLVLGEVENAAASMVELSEQIHEMQEFLEGRTSTSASTTKTGVTLPVKKAESPKIAAERIITVGDAAMALEFVVEAVGHLDAAEASLLKLEDKPADVNEVNSVFRAFHTIKGVAGFLDFKQIGALAHAAETLLELARKGKLQLVGPILDAVLEARDVMRKMVDAVETAAKTNQAPALQDGLEGVLQRLRAATNGDAIQPSAASTATAAPSPVAVAISSPAQTPTSSTGQGDIRSESVVKVATSRLDALINTVGELVIAEAMVAQGLGSAVLAADQRLLRNISHLGKITRSLQDLSMSMRMVPIAGVFQKMARLARDVSHKAGKDIDFVQIGSETELDRNVVEAISDPLVHMVRNAIDHGLEYPEDRQKAGKPRNGKLILNAFHQAGNVVIEITDDGHGLDKEKIIAKAITAGFVKEGQELSEQQIFLLIFHPGLSTAEKLTDISGRGVGMDVVRKNVEALRGRIEISSALGKGSTFTVRLPLTLAVIDGLIVRVGPERYIIPITSIEQSLRPTAKQLSSISGKGELCMVRDKLLPIIRLHRLFNVTPKTEDPTAALVVIVQDGINRCCLLVDELVGQQQVVIKSVGKEIGPPRGVAGCAILGDGNVSLILDIAGIIHSVL
jgi:two-component system, chemotaxis family, sensor kinase CheA